MEQHMYGATEILGDTFQFRNLNYKTYSFSDIPNNDAATLEIISGIDVRNYWLASRSVFAQPDGASFLVRSVGFYARSDS